MVSGPLVRARSSTGPEEQERCVHRSLSAAKRHILGRRAAARELRPPPHEADLWLVNVFATPCEGKSNSVVFDFLGAESVIARRRVQLDDHARVQLVWRCRARHHGRVYRG